MNSKFNSIFWSKFISEITLATQPNIRNIPKCLGISLFKRSNLNHFLEQEKEKNKKGAQIVIENEVKAIGDHKSGESDYISAEEDIDDADVEKIRKAEKIPDLEEEPSDDGNGKLANSHSEHNYGDDNAHLQHGSLMGAGDFLQMFMDQHQHEKRKEEEEDKLKDKLKDNQHPANDKHVGEDDYYDHNGDRGFGFMHAVKWAMNAQENKTG
jgi:hypothetical protein